MAITITAAEIKAAFSEFNSREDTEVEFLIEEALMIHAIRKRATMLLVAHLLKISEGDARGGSGEVQHRQAGSTLTSYRAQTERGREAFFMATNYGRRFRILEQRSRRTGAGSVVIA